MSCADCDPTVGEDPEEPQRWLPDEQLVHAILAGGHRDIRTLGHEDRSWVIAGLKAFGRPSGPVADEDESRRGRGMTSEDIAERLCCSLRLVRTIQARPLTRIAEYALAETKNFTDELRLARSEMAVREITEIRLREELKRTREQLNRLIDAQIVGEDVCKRCGTPFDKVNTYFEAGKRRCRECNRRKQQKWRDRQKYLIEAGQTIGLGEIGLIPRNSLDLTAETENRRVEAGLTSNSAAGAGFRLVGFTGDPDQLDKPLPGDDKVISTRQTRYTRYVSPESHHLGGDSLGDPTDGDAPRCAPEQL